MASPLLSWIARADNLVVPGGHSKIEISGVISLSVVYGIGLG